MQSNSVIFWWNLGPRITSRSIFCILNGCKSVTTCACGQEESVDPCYWMAGVTVGELQGLVVHRDTTVRAVRFYHFELNKDVNKGRVKRMQGECSPNLDLICCRDQIHYWEYFRQASPHCCVAPCNHFHLCFWQDIFNVFGMHSRYAVYQSSMWSLLYYCSTKWAIEVFWIVNLHCLQRDGGFYVAVRDDLKSEFALLLNVSGGLILIHQLSPLLKKHFLSSWAGRIIHFFSHKKKT